MLMTLPGLWLGNAGPHTPLSIVDYARDRDRTNVDQRFDTLLHMQYPNTPAAWEYALPNGTYSVTVSVGDKPNPNGVYDSKHTINVEGASAIKDFQGNSSNISWQPSRSTLRMASLASMRSAPIQSLTTLKS